MGNFFGVIARAQTYLNMFYLLMAFPLGLLYFVFLVTGLSVGFGLIIVWVGIPILLGIMFAWAGFAMFERQMARIILNEKIVYQPLKLSQEKNLWVRFKKHISNSSTWRSFSYLLIKFPLGIMSFVILIALLSVSLSLISTPILYYLADAGVILADVCIEGQWCSLNTPFVMIIMGIVGVFLLFVSLHVFNGVAKLSGSLAKSMLGRGRVRIQPKKQPVKRKTTATKKKPVKKKAKPKKKK